MDRAASSSFDVDPMHGGLVSHPTPPEAMRTVGGPPRVAWFGGIMATQFCEQLAKAGSYETNQIVVRR